MSQYSCIGAIYRKELIDILRDRRTMTAMVVIPVVLYPLIMLGFVWATEVEEARLRAQRFVAEVGDDQAKNRLDEIITGTQIESRSPDEEKTDFEVRVGNTPPEQLGDQVHLHVSFGYSAPSDQSPQRPHIEVAYNEVSVRSRTAMEELTKIFNRFSELLTRKSLSEILEHEIATEQLNESIELILKPIEISSVSVATDRQRGGWALGQIIPIILVLMTITGAIYPAIDLTAGERERGTLETLMATPVPVIHLIVGKFLVVATVGMLAAVLNIASVGATMHFGGLTRAITSEMPVEFPYYVFPIILFCMIPFALLFSAILVAVCSFARTFKEAQNYVMPVIIVAMIPAIAVTLPTVRLEGVMMVLPVGNMVLLTRELFQQTCDWKMIVVVVLSTTLYAAAAVALASRLFGQEAVLFADAGSYKTLFRRRFFKPSLKPTVSQALLLAALLFPMVFYANSLLNDVFFDNFIHAMGWLAIIQFASLFVLLPLVVTIYLKINVVEAFRLRRPAPRIWVAAILMGLSSWVLAYEFFLLQSRWIPQSEAFLEFGQRIETQLAASPLWIVVLLLAVVPAAGEEFLFRGFLLSGIGNGLRKWPAILIVSAIFGIFHFFVFKMPVTALLGIVLAYTCWQSRSIFPGIVFHAMHNAALMVLDRIPKATWWLGMADATGNPTNGRLPISIIVSATILFVAGMAIVGTEKRDRFVFDEMGEGR